MKHYEKEYYGTYKIIKNSIILYGANSLIKKIVEANTFYPNGMRYASQSCNVVIPFKNISHLELTSDYRLYIFIKGVDKYYTISTSVYYTSSGATAKQEKSHYEMIDREKEEILNLFNFLIDIISK